MTVSVRWAVRTVGRVRDVIPHPGDVGGVVTVRIERVEIGMLQRVDQFGGSRKRLSSVEPERRPSVFLIELTCGEPEPPSGSVVHQKARRRLRADNRRQRAAKLLLIRARRDRGAAPAAADRGGEQDRRHSSGGADGVVQPNAHEVEESKPGAYSPRYR